MDGYLAESFHRGERECLGCFMKKERLECVFQKKRGKAEVFQRQNVYVKSSKARNAGLFHDKVLKFQWLFRNAHLHVNLAYKNRTRSLCMSKVFRRSYDTMKKYVASPTGRRDDSLAESCPKLCSAGTRPAESLCEVFSQCELHDGDLFLPLTIFRIPFLFNLLQRPPTSHVKMQLRRDPIMSMFERLLGVPWPLDDKYYDLQPEELHSLALSFPKKRFFPFLPFSSLLTLRLVSKTTKSWIDKGLRSLDLSFPFKSKEYEANSNLPSRQASRLCAKLIVNVAASKIPLRTMYNIFWAAQTLPKYASLEHLHINAPSSDSFWPLLEFRMFIQAVDRPHLRRFSINGLSIEGLKALRWGPMTSYLDADWTSVMWRQLTNLDISFAPSMGVADLTSEEGTEALQILHDWIGSFRENDFQKVRFEWMGDQKGPNPFLLDKLEEMCESDEKPKMQRISWRSCKEIWLGGVCLDTKNSRKMMTRVKGLKRVMIWTSLLERKTKAGERIVHSRGQEWVVIELSRRRRIKTNFPDENTMQHDTLEEIVRQYHEETEPQVTHGQTLENWSTDDMSGGRGVGKTYCGDSDDALSDASREVPIYLDCM